MIKTFYSCAKGDAKTGHESADPNDPDQEIFHLSFDIFHLSFSPIDELGI
ncbi:MAG TPA: hypothetical protein VGJ66_24365 [Pyrinomonadaceae bacterium]